MSATATEKQAAVDLLVEEGVIERDDDGEVLTEAQVDKAMAVDNWINDLGGFDDAAIVVYQVDPSSNKMEYIESMGVQEMTGPMLFEKLKNEYGGGKFRIQMRADGAIRKTQTVLIKKVPVKEKDPTGMGVDLPSLVRELKAGQNNNGMEAIVQMIQAQNASFQQMFMQLVTGMNNNNAPVVDPVAMQASMFEGLEKLQKMAGLNKPEKSATDMILEGVKLVGAIREGGDGGEANIYTLLSKAVDGFGDTLGAAMQMSPGGIPTPPANPALAGQEPAPQITDASKPAEIKPDPNQPLPEGHPLAPFEPFVNWMLGLAEKNANPELYAEVIIDQIGAEPAQQWLATEEGLTILKEQLPRCVPHENWLRLVGREIAILIEEGELDLDPPDDQGDNVVEPIAQDGDVRTGLGPDGASEPSSPITIDQPSVDGDTERTGGDTNNAEIDGEPSKPSENDPANT